MTLRLTKNWGKLFFQKKKCWKYVIFWKEKTYNSYLVRKNMQKRERYVIGVIIILKKRLDVIWVRIYAHFDFHIIFIITWHIWLIKLYLIHEEWEKYFGCMVHVYCG